MILQGIGLTRRERSNELGSGVVVGHREKESE